MQLWEVSGSQVPRFKINLLRFMVWVMVRQSLITKWSGRHQIFALRFRII